MPVRAVVPHRAFLATPDGPQKRPISPCQAEGGGIVYLPPAFPASQGQNVATAGGLRAVSRGRCPRMRHVAFPDTGA